MKIDDPCKGDNPKLVTSADSSVPLSQILADLLNTSDLVVLEVVGMCDEYKTQALRVKCSLSTKNWRAFCVSQLSRNVGARVLHRYANRQNAPSPVPLFRPGALHKTPNDAVDADAAHWAGFWQKPRDQRDAHEVLEKMRNACTAGLRVETSFDEFDMPPFTSDLLLGSAKTYRKTSKGSDHRLSVEVCLPVPVLDPLAHAIDFSITLMAWPQQKFIKPPP